MTRDDHDGLFSISSQLPVPGLRPIPGLRHISFTLWWRRFGHKILGLNPAYPQPLSTFLKIAHGAI